ncbi:DUF3788 family protein [Dysgonomonas sp. Marseille-P4677]|uniref:DUF3788 family protein n=1 Tax=Dysgonomonas sp. Marseille-P4677 TaxID=2364790 RepID=UPI001914AE98|nr:DUF3788 family protein [Dysgonomonas sp. Marseille-P4677]MBK5722120.1 DUF3788 family protein [Dysgonomonas sp. Marseille-P4677]
MEVQMLLRDPEIFPSNEVLRNALGNSVYNVLESFIETVTNEKYGLTIEWRFYNDGKAWLGKLVHKKKTILWLSVWNGFFKTSFFFTEKHLEAISALDISEKIKEEFCTAKSVGKLIPMLINVNESSQLTDIFTIILFKKG